MQRDGDLPGLFEHAPGHVTPGLLPFLIWGPVYRKRCDPDSGPLRGLAYACYIYTFYITVWRAVFRLARRRNGWAKTRRNTEYTNTKVVALDR